MSEALGGLDRTASSALGDASRSEADDGSAFLRSAGNGESASGSWGLARGATTGLGSERAIGGASSSTSEAGAAADLVDISKFKPTLGTISEVPEDEESLGAGLRGTGNDHASTGGADNDHVSVNGSGRLDEEGGEPNLADDNASTKAIPEEKSNFLPKSVIAWAEHNKTAGDAFDKALKPITVPLTPAFAIAALSVSATSLHNSEKKSESSNSSGSKS